MFVAGTLLLLGASSARALPLEIITTSLGAGTAGVAYSDAVVAASGTTPYSWTIDSGSLPGGITLDGSTGELSGTATLAGTSDFIVLVTDAVGDTATRALSIAITAAAPSILAIEVQPSNVTAGATISPAVQVSVRDEFGNGVAGESVSLALVGSGTLTGGGAVVTDGSGIATFSGLSVDVAGSKQLTASSGALTPVTSDAFSVSAGTAATLSFEVQPSNVAAGATISPAVQVSVRDEFGNGVAGESVSLALVGSGTLTGGGAVLTDGAGIATFSGLSVDAAGSKQLTASSGELTPATSDAFGVSAGSAATLSFEVQPSNVAAGATMTPAVQVKVADALGNGVTGESVSLALVGSGTLTGGGAVVTDGSGIATFSGLSVDVAGSKQLTASSGALTPVTSDAFGVSAGTAATLSFEVQPSSVLVGATITPAVQVKAVDGLGNPVSGVDISLAIVGTGTLTGGAAVATDPSGVATFSALSIDRAGSAQLSASAGALGPVLSASFDVSCPVITVGPASLPGGSAGNAYSQTLTGSGGTSPYTFAVTAGALPAGLSLGASGDLSGTPSAGGSFSFTVTATDANLCIGSQGYLVIICAPISVLPASLPAAPQGSAYSQSLSATGGIEPYAFAVTAGALPAGLTLSSTGLLSGTPTVTGVFDFTVTATASGDCTGFREYSLSVPGIPAAVSDLTATPLSSGNDGDGTVRIQVGFTPTTFAVSAEVYRAPFGGYPRYDDDGGLVPPTPSYPPGSPWVLTGVTASGQTDEPSTRDTYHYVVFLKNEVGQVSSVSNKTAGCPNYALGDVSNGFTAGSGDNLVNDLDVSLLGAHYGITGSAILAADVSYLDVGPTIDLGMTSRPYTDARLDFEDLIVIATNYGAVSSPAAVIAASDAAARAATARENLSVLAPSLVEAGATFTAVVRMAGAGRVQGLSVELAWDPSVAEPIATLSSGWVESQQGVLWPARAGAFDAALLGARSRGMSGEGELATVTFRARRLGDPAVRLSRVLARDAANRPLGQAAISFGTEAGAPARTLLFAPAPNPSHRDAGVSFALAHPGNVELAIYSVDGRRVRVLARGAYPAGTYRFTWNGDDEQHHAVAPGVYYAQLAAGGKRFSRTLVLLQ